MCKGDLEVSKKNRNGWFVRTTPRQAYFLVLFTGVYLIQSCALPATCTSAEKHAKLILDDGVVIAGHPIEWSAPDQIRWQGDSFCDPFVFRQRAIQEMVFAQTGELEATAETTPGLFRFEFKNGDVIIGAVTQWDDKTIVIENRFAGALRLSSQQVKSVRAIRRLQPVVGDTSSLDGTRSTIEPAWTHVPAQGVATARERTKLADQGMMNHRRSAVNLFGDGYTVQRKIPLKDRILLDITFGWTGVPDFVLAFGFAGRNVPDRSTRAEGRSEGLATGRLGTARFDGWRIECAGSRLVLIVERDGFVDLEPLASLDQRSGIRLLVYHDPHAGTVEVLADNGQPLGRLDVGPANPSLDTNGDQNSVAHTQLSIQNLSANSLGVSEFDLTRWVGDIARVPRPVSEGQNDTFSVQKMKPFAGSVVGFDPGKKYLTVRAANEVISFPLARLAEVRCNAPPEPLSKGKGRVHLVDGSTLSGTIQGFKADQWTILSSGSNSMLALPLGSVRSINLRKDQPSDNQEAAVIGRVGRLVIHGNELPGRLVKATGEGNPEAYDLAWHPLKSVVAARIRRGVSGKVVFKTPPKLKNNDTAAQMLEQQRQKNQRLRRGLNFGELFLQRTDLSKRAPVNRDAHLVHLVTGDIVRCRVDSISDGVVQVTSESADSQKIDFTVLKAIEFVSNSPPPNLDAAKKQRLLTIPRVQKSEPPTHLLCSHNGDFLRCILTGMTDNFIVVQVHGNELRLPRERIAQVIWFHDNELQDGGSVNSVDPHSSGEESRVAGKGDLIHHGITEDKGGVFDYHGLMQVVRNDGKRFTVEPTSIEGERLEGQSPWLGQREFDLGRVDEILIGDEIPTSVETVAYNQWRLKSAVEPLVNAVLEDSKPKKKDATTLVGSEMPQVTVSLVKGGELRLSDLRGGWVMIDFWASWSATSVETLSGLEVIREKFGREQVTSVSVSVGETKRVVADFMSKASISASVIADTESRLAERFGVSVLPQVVLISPQGVIKAVFLGGGASMLAGLEDELSSGLGISSEGETIENSNAAESE